MPVSDREETVLVIDDDFVTRQVAEAVLSGAGYAVETMGCGRQALDWLETREAAIVVTDIFMPDVDGLEILMAVRRFCPQARVLAISGGSKRIDKDFLPVAERLGADDTLAKPFRPTALLQAVRRLLAQDAAVDVA